jgi:hypothetical protein
MDCAKYWNRVFRAYGEKYNLFGRLESGDVKWECDGHLTAAKRKGCIRIPIGCELVPRGVITLQSRALTLPDSAPATDSTLDPLQFQLYYRIESNSFGCSERIPLSTHPSPHGTYVRRSVP